MRKTKLFFSEAKRPKSWDVWLVGFFACGGVAGPAEDFYAWRPLARLGTWSGQSDAATGRGERSARRQSFGTSVDPQTPENLGVAWGNRHPEGQIQASA